MRILMLGSYSVSVGSRILEEVAAAARRSQDAAAYQAAIELYAGELLPEDHYEEWAEEHRRRLREVHDATPPQ